MIFRTTWVLIAISCVACGSKKDADVARTGSGGAELVERGRLFSEAELTTLVDGMTKRLDANAHRSCSGPRVRGAELGPGPSGPLLVELFEAQGELAACMARLEELAKGDLRKAIDELDPAMVAFDSECGASIAAKVVAAAGHAEGCSPYQVGVRREPKDLIHVLHVMHAVAFHAHRMAAAGDTTEAIQLDLDALRAFQDLARGHVTMLSAMLSVAAMETMSESLDGALDTAKLDAAQLATAADALDRLTADAPRFAEILEGEYENMEIYFGAAQLMPKSWTPPGGWNEELHGTGGDGGLFKSDPDVNQRDLAGLFLTLTLENRAELAKVCGSDATYRQCVEGLTRLTRLSGTHGSETPAVPDLKPLYADLAKATTSGDTTAVRLRIRSSIIQVLRSVAQAAYEKYAVKLALGVARLAELRLHVEVLRGKTCPTTGQLAAPPYDRIARPLALGDGLDLKASPGQIEVHQPAWSDPTKVWTFHCGG